MRGATTALLGLVLLGGAAVAIPVGEAAVLAQDGPAVAARDYKPDAQECAFLGKINTFRKKQGKPALQLDASLGAAAENHSRDMADRNYFSHTVKGDNRTWEQNIRAFGYKSSPTGENIAAATDGSSAKKAMKMWENSPPHRKTMLDGSFRAIGVGRDFGKKSKYGWYWTTTFGGKVENPVKC